MIEETKDAETGLAVVIDKPCCLSMVGVLFYFYF
jgi:hypothetical protein